MEMIRQGLETDSTKQDLLLAFKIFDREDKGFISSEYVKEIMTNLGDKLTEEEVDELVKAADPDGTGQIDYEGKIMCSLKHGKTIHSQIRIISGYQESLLGESFCLRFQRHHNTEIWSKLCSF